MAKTKNTLRVLTAVLAMVMIISTIFTVHLSATGTTYYGSSPSINKLNGNIDLGTEKLYNEAVMYKLPDNVKETDDLSIKVESVVDHRIDSTTVIVKEKPKDDDEDDDDEELDEDGEDRRKKKKKSDKDKENNENDEADASAETLAETTAE